MRAVVTSLRASSLPLAFLCPAAVRASDLRINESHAAAYSGTAAHECVRPLPATGRIDWDEIPRIAGRYNADPDETRMLAALGASLWNAPFESGGTVGNAFAGAVTEQSFSAEVTPGVVLTGHADLIVFGSREIRIGDWKFGRKDRDYSQQLRAYAALGLLAMPGAERSTATILWAREKEIENYTVDRAAANAWLRELIDFVINWDGVYRPGAHCLHCPRNHECAAANALLRRDLAIVADKALVARVECELDLMSPSDIVQALRKADTVVHFAKRIRDAIRSHVERNGDVVADGVRLTAVVEESREIDPLAAWAVLQRHGFTDEDFARSMDLRISRIEDIVRGKTPKGKGARAIRELSAELEKCHAVTKRRKTKLLEKRQP